jgi:hypothetical protein
MVGFAMLQGWEVLAYNMGSDDVASPAVVATAVDDITSSPAGATALILFMLLGFGGLLVTLVSLWRSQVVPRRRPSAPGRLVRSSKLDRGQHPSRAFASACA